MLITFLSIVVNNMCQGPFCNDIYCAIILCYPYAGLDLVSPLYSCPAFHCPELVELGETWDLNSMDVARKPSGRSGMYDISLVG